MEPRPAFRYQQTGWPQETWLSAVLLVRFYPVNWNCPQEKAVPVSASGQKANFLCIKLYISPAGKRGHWSQRGKDCDLHTNARKHPIPHTSYNGSWSCVRALYRVGQMCPDTPPHSLAPQHIGSSTLPTTKHDHLVVCSIRLKTGVPIYFNSSLTTLNHLLR